MATYTPNLNLKKPAASDAADIADINGNMDLIDTAVAAIVNTIYPVGAIYLSTNAASPVSLFGGTWEQIKDTFLLTAGDSYAAGDVGGEARHTLTANELPAVSGSFRIRALSNGGNTVDNTSGVVSVSAGSSLTPLSYASGSSQAAQEVSLSFGGGQPHNIMPPYLAVYAWKRTA